MLSMFNVFFFNDTATTEIYTLSLHDALPIFGLVFVWAAFVGLATQYFLNMEIERYTLATGETALTGFSRYWRHWGLVFAILAYFAKDRKSTRLNSSHANISYAVFCLKKKKINYALLSFL